MIKNKPTLKCAKLFDANNLIKVNKKALKLRRPIILHTKAVTLGNYIKKKKDTLKLHQVTPKKIPFLSHRVMI